MTRSALKKIENAGGKEGVAASPAKAGGGRKRKANVDADGDDAEGNTTPKPKKSRAKAGKKAAAELGEFTLSRIKQNQADI
jgi:hypothetical protein